MCSWNHWILQEKTRYGTWIGGTDQFQEGNWTWTDCSPWKFTRWGIRSAHMQPDNSSSKDGDGENCLLFPSDKSPTVDWNDAPCNLRERQFVCSKPICSPGMTLWQSIYLLPCFLSETTAGADIIGVIVYYNLPSIPVLLTLIGLFYCCWQNCHLPKKCCVFCQVGLG